MRAALDLPLSHNIVAIGLPGLSGLVTFGAPYLASSKYQESARAMGDNARGISDLNQ
jgi:methyl-accepting chemotaxis protein